jgi:hypothetical protein
MVVIKVIAGNRVKTLGLDGKDEGLQEVPCIEEIVSVPPCPVLPAASEEKHRYVEDEKGLDVILFGFPSQQGEAEISRAVVIKASFQSINTSGQKINLAGIKGPGRRHAPQVVITAGMSDEGGY